MAGFFHIRDFIPNDAQRILPSAEPRELALGVAAAALLDEVEGLALGRFPLEKGGDLLIADGLHGGTIRGEPGGKKRLHLIGKPRLFHRVDTRVDARIEVGAVSVIEDYPRRVIALGARGGDAVMLGNGSAGEQIYLYGAHDTPFVA